MRNRRKDAPGDQRRPFRGRPFPFTAGLASPVHIDCRKLMSYPRLRSALMDVAASTIARRAGFEQFDAAAGGETAGVPFGPGCRTGLVCRCSAYARSPGALAAARRARDRAGMARGLCLLRIRPPMAGRRSNSRPRSPAAEPWSPRHWQYSTTTFSPTRCGVSQRPAATTLSCNLVGHNKGLQERKPASLGNNRRGGELPERSGFVVRRSWRQIGTATLTPRSV